MIYAITGKMFIGTTAAPITAIDGTGGVELKSVEGRKFAFDTGIKLTIEKDGKHHRVKKLPAGPGILAVPYHGASDADVSHILSPMSDDGTSVDPNQGDGEFAELEKKQILILPLDGTKRVLYIKEAQLHPDTQKELRWDPAIPHLPDFCQWLASSEEDGSNTPAWKYGAAAVVEAVYFP